MKTLDEELRDYERAYLVDVLTMTQGNVSEAAKLAGRARTQFYLVMKRHALNPEDYRGK